jgi:hypothetical protein
MLRSHPDPIGEEWHEERFGCTIVQPNKSALAMPV